MNTFCLKNKHFRRNNVKASLLCAITLGWASWVNAAEESDHLFEDLLQELEQVTEIATHTKLNIDYVPGMVTVLEGEKLRNAGLLTFEEALETVPGVEVTISNDGQNDVVMRGIGKTISSGKVKLLINGRSTNAALSAASTTSTLPLELVERIEIIRGPGSAVYGEYAYAGVVNVILRKDSHLFYSGSHHDKHAMGGVISNHTSDEPLKYSLSFSAYKRKGDEVIAGEDYLKASQDVYPYPSNSPGTSNELEKILSTSLQLSYDKFQWDTFFQQQDVGDYFGIYHALPPELDYIRRVTTATSDIDGKFNFGDELSIEASAGVRYYALRGSIHYFLPENFPDFTSGIPPTEFFSDGALGIPNYTEYEAHTSLTINYSGINKHDILFGLYTAYIDQGDTWATRNNIFVSTPSGPVVKQVPLQDYRGNDNWLKENNKRVITSVFAQDQWHVFDPLTITIGARFDDYHNQDHWHSHSFNPRLAAVYNFQDTHVFKAQYSEAFRPPTFLELFSQNNIISSGNPDMNAEEISTLEFGYIHNNSLTKSKVRLTAFNSELDELITIDASGQYQNQGSVNSKGIEFEIVNTLIPLMTIEANSSFMRVMEKETGNALPHVANLLGNFDVTYQFEKFSSHAGVQYMGKRKREIGDTRSAMDDYLLLNASLSSGALFNKNMVFRVGIKNLLDHDVVHPAPLISFGGSELPTYANDYPRPGREIWLNIEYNL